LLSVEAIRQRSIQNYQELRNVLELSVSDPIKNEHSVDDSPSTYKMIDDNCDTNKVDNKENVANE